MNNILLVEDDTMIASGITYALEMEGYEVCHVTTAADARNFIEKGKFNLAILDMQLPDGIGLNLSEKLKNTNTSVIFLTVVDDENIIVKAFDDGAADYIVKPFRIRELLARVRRVLSIRKAFPVLYSIPCGILVVGMAALIAVVMLITCVEMNKMKDKSIIDEIRMDVM